MEFLECVNRARATREFTDEPVSEDDIRFLIDTARRAGSGKNRQPWTFIVLQKDERRKTLASFGDYSSPLEQAPIGIVVLSDIRESTDEDSDFNAFDCGRAIQNLILAAASRGIGTVPQSIRKKAAAEDYLSVPANKNILVAMAVGHPKGGEDDEIEGTKKEEVLLKTGREPLEEILYWEQYHDA